MSGKRSQGRPVRGVDAVGRQRILDGARDFLRAASTGPITRKNLAAFTAVTPALITYYFPEYPTLLEAATRPVIEGYVEQLRAILRGRYTTDDKLRRVIDLFIQCNKRDGRILDCFAALVATSGVADRSDALKVLFEEATGFLEEHLDGDALDPEFVHGALWGMCRSVARRDTSLRLQDLLDESVGAQSDDPKQVESIYRLVTTGIRWRMQSIGSVPVE